MIPIRDANPSVSRPVFTWLLVAASVYVFFAIQPRTTSPAGQAFFYENATIPCEVTQAEPLTEAEVRSDVCRASDGPAIFPDKSILASIFASLFLHGDLAHLIGNMWVLWIFGNNVEDAFGKLGYLLFYLVGGVAASFAHIAFNPDSTIPVVGASGAIAAVMGAYLVLFPRARVVSVFPIFFFLPVAVPAFLFLLIWFLGQFGLAGASTAIAWEAHVGGFLFGLLVAAFLRTTLLRRIYSHRVAVR